jgi:hypothetical protein
MHISMVGQAGITNKSTLPEPALMAREIVAVGTEQIRPETQTIEPASAEPETSVADEAENNDGAKGVLRLLQEGHFKGVADVRLRINFHDEIAAMETEKAAQIADTGVTTLLELVSAQTEALTQENDLGEQTALGIQEALDTFNAALPQGLDEYKTGDISSVSELSARLQAGFDEFISTIQAIFVPDAVTPEGTVAPEVDDVNPAAENLASVAEDVPSTDETPSFDYQAFIADLTEEFKAKLLEMETALNSVQVLPPLSEPHGNGTAYQKFLNMYNEMQGVTEPEPNQPAVNTIA